MKASISPSTQYIYERALARLEAALDGRPFNNATLADYLSTLFKSGKSQGTVKQVVSAVRHRARLAGEADPVGPDSAWVLAENRYENLSPSAEDRLVEGIRHHAKLLGDPDPVGSDSDVLKEFKKRDRWTVRLKYERGRMPEGRRFMGKLYRRDLDYPKILSKGPNFRMCRACGEPDLRMSGVYWCFACGFLIRKARRQVRGRMDLLASVFGSNDFKGDVEWKSLMAVVREIRAQRGAR